MRGSEGEGEGGFDMKQKRMLVLSARRLALSELWLARFDDWLLYIDLASFKTN